MEEEIDILMATYNGEKHLKEQIESILKQTYKKIKLIISDDCSNDSTREILKTYEKKDKRIKVYYQKENQGYIRNFEFLLKNIQNKTYMLSDQDDVWLPEKVEKTYEVFKKSKADLVFGDLEIVDENLRTIYPSFGDFMKLNRKIKKNIDTYKVNYLYNCVTGCTLMSKKEYIQKIEPVPYKSNYVVHDHWIGIIVGLEGKLEYIPEKYIKYRQHGNNQIGTDKISHGFKKIEQVRKLFIEVKIGVFGTYVQNNKKFPKDLQKLNKKAYDYFNMIEKKKNFNFKNWGVFHELYKNETIIYYLQNFAIMNLPFLIKGIFKIRYSILKAIKKRQ